MPKKRKLQPTKVIGSVDAVIKEKGLKSENIRAKNMFQQCIIVI
jgi:hypothetical protein